MKSLIKRRYTGWDYLISVIDNSNSYRQIILTGSQTFHLTEHVTETLDGSIGILEFHGLSTREINKDPFD
jgi:hypothetical protein